MSHPKKNLNEDRSESFTSDTHLDAHLDSISHVNRFGKRQWCFHLMLATGPPKQLATGIPLASSNFGTLRFFGKYLPSWESGLLTIIVP